MAQSKLNRPKGFRKSNGCQMTRSFSYMTICIFTGGLKQIAECSLLCLDIHKAIGKDAGEQAFLGPVHDLLTL